MRIAKQSFKRAVAVSTLAIGMVAAGTETAHALTVVCPNNMTGAWTGAAFGRTTAINTQMVRYFVIDVPTTNLACERQSTTPSVITQVVQLSPGAIPALCGGAVRISGLAFTTGGVPPFGGFNFESGKINAVPTYNQSTGRCQLDVAITHLLVGENVTQACSGAALNAWNCPSGVNPASIAPNPADRLATLLLPQSPELSRVLDRYEAFRSAPLLGL